MVGDAGAGGVGGVISATVTEGTESNVSGLIKNIIKFFRGIAVAVALICLLILGIKTIVGGVEEKADTKKAIYPFVIGAVIVVFAAEIAIAIFNVF